MINYFHQRKKSLILPILVTATVSTLASGVFALDTSEISNYKNTAPYYTNNNGITVTEKEYNIINEYYGNGYFDNMSLEDYEWLRDLDINNSENTIEVKTIYESPVRPLGAIHETASKRIAIIKSCSTYCTIVTTATWLVVPKVRSYDVIGARFMNTNLANDSITTRVRSSSSTTHFDEVKRYSTGFGVSVKLPTNENGIIVDQKFYVNSGGIVFASYQHAAKNISLATSKLYTLGASGYGNVFIFYGDATDVFDQMNGVSIEV